jgi:hypothetical protein
LRLSSEISWHCLTVQIPDFTLYPALGAADSG